MGHANGAEGRKMFIAFPPTFMFPSGLPKTFLPTHHIFYSQRLFDMKDGLPKYAKHKEEGAPMVDEEEDADRSHDTGSMKTSKKVERTAGMTLAVKKNPRNDKNGNRKLVDNTL
jgi:hypothetical protein